MNPVSLLLKNLIYTTLLVVMLYRVRKAGTLLLFSLVSMLVSALLLGASITLLPAILLGALMAEASVALCGGYGRACELKLHRCYSPQQMITRK